MVKVLMNNKGQMKMDISSIDGHIITNIKASATTWMYNEEKELPYLSFCVRFEFKEDLGTEHQAQMMKFHGEKDFNLEHISFSYHFKWGKREFHFNKNEINKDKILTNLTNHLLQLSKLPVITSISFSEVPPFCPTCTAPLGDWEWDDHGMNCTIWSMKRMFGFVVEGDYLYSEMTVEEATDILKNRLLEPGYFDSIISEHNLNEKEIRNIKELMNNE